MRIIYMGTPDFAVNALVSLVDAGHEVVACYTQPDKPKGRSKALQPTPVKVKAFEYGIPVYQPVKLREAENVEKIKQYAPDAIVVAAYGQILPESTESTSLILRDTLTSLLRLSVHFVYLTEL